MKRHLGRRGSVLLLVVVLLAVISLLAAAAVAFSHSELGAARNERSGDELLACADAGRQYMLSRFSQFSDPAKLSIELATEGINLASGLDLNSAGLANCPPGNVPKDARCLRSGHINQVTVNNVIQVSAKAGGNRKDLRDLTNIVGDGSFGGKPYKVMVHCMDENGRGTEVEFVVRLGL
ncbi:hypothetical protein [Vitiosangium sp. GDMCC 1.1324]|uniref:hypothetical protein n=1 Tax=Vitiosangium sp. (strain GDMCC 1.1324) TaxID=2138576 RepID=UPI000D37D3F9|nr:hypothetical protein [Vitiosangium sp. GDMCC 1.1324]PTL82258.1 hypothetical protein DAT35_20940 [Vitiosangium sp. GDMCC 1.1324]